MPCCYGAVAAAAAAAAACEYWQSDGSLPHWIDVVIPQSIVLGRLSIQLASRPNPGREDVRVDHSYCPRVIRVSVGASKESLCIFSSMEISISRGWIHLIHRDTVVEPERLFLLDAVKVVRIEIVHNHMSGQNSRLSRVRLERARPSCSASFRTSFQERCCGRLRGAPWAIMGLRVVREIEITDDVLLGMLSGWHFKYEDIYPDLSCAGAFCGGAQESVGRAFARQDAGVRPTRRMEPRPGH